jgi:hypothetical protein
MRIHVPKDLGDELRLLPEGVAEATLERVIIGKSKAGQPKATLRYVLTSELPVNPNEPSTIGETVLETYSLQEQALFRLNRTYREVTGERLPEGDYSPEELEEILNDALGGTQWTLVLGQEVPADGSSTEPRTVVKDKKLRP